VDNAVRIAEDRRVLFAHHGAEAGLLSAAVAAAGMVPVGVYMVRERLTALRRRVERLRH
jgi:hypothetical protein